MTNYLPARLIVMPKDDDTDYNPIIDQMIEDRMEMENWENDLYEREEGISYE